MIDHPAIPKMPRDIPRHHTMLMDEAAEVTAQAMVTWLESISIYRNTDYGGISITADDWQYLRKKVWEK
jgi:hypothetical protein